MQISITITGETPASVALLTLRRSDTGAAPAGVTLPLVFAPAGGGVYTVTFTDPSSVVCTYTYGYTVTWSDSTTAGEFFGQVVSAGSPIVCYFASTQISDAIAGGLPSKLVAAYVAASGGEKFPALAQATLDIDQGQKYQGRRYGSTQLTEFPRVAYESAGRMRPHGIIDFDLPAGASDTVWDWDRVNQVAIVPAKVLTACVYQANYILAGGDPRLDEIHSGVNQSVNSGLTEMYDRKAPGVDTSLCLRAWQLLKNYKLVSGRLT